MSAPSANYLGDAVMSSIQTLLMIGGFIIIFSVINKLLFHLHISSFLAKGIDLILILIGFPLDLSIPIFSGLFEMTIGSQLVSGVQECNPHATSHYGKSPSWLWRFKYPCASCKYFGANRYRFQTFFYC